MDFKNWLFSEDDYYNLLGITQMATSEQINKAYRHKAKNTHPDLFPPDTIEYFEAEKNFKKLLVAKDTLLDPIKRDEYDKQRLIIQESYISSMKMNYPIVKEEKKEQKKHSFKDELNKVKENKQKKNYNYDSNKNVYYNIKDEKEHKHFNYTEKINYGDEIYAETDDIEENDFDESFTMQKKSLDMKKRAAKNYYELGVRAIGYKDYNRAWVCFQSARYLDPDLKVPPSLWNLALQSRTKD